MTPVLSRAQSQAFDAYAIETCKVPSLVLMENAGRGATDVLVTELLGGDATGARVAVVCGTGNNGGDGFVIARRLAVMGARPVVLLAGPADSLSHDARANCEAWRGIGGDVRDVSQAPLTPLGEAVATADVIVDALFGTGLSRPIEGHAAEVIGALGAARAPVLAVDLPSGLDADTGAVLGVAVRARVTATFAHRKLGLLTPTGACWAGKVVLVDIGVPGALAAPLGPTVTMIEPADVVAWRTPRVPGAYKTAVGHVLIVGGSPGRVGAPQLTMRGALRAGAGLATILTWPSVASAIEGQILEAMTARIEPSRADELLKDALSGKHAVVAGPGLGVGPEERHVVERLLAAWRGPLVIDADALTMFAGDIRPLTGLAAAILTPHPGELARLSGSSITHIEGDRFKAAASAASSLGAVVVLKGAHTVVAAPDGRIAVSPVACPALATAGAGDVLSGVIAALACSLPPFEAACAGVMIHAMAGEAWSRAHGGADRGLLASEIADAIPTLGSVSPYAGPTARR
jgi:NAD(P)H-hydrate epimerase